MNSDSDFPPPLIVSQTAPAPRPRKRRWWLIALVALALMVALVVVSLLGMAWFARSAILRYTDTQPVELPKVTASEQSGAALRDRLGQFFVALKGDKPLEPLKLSADDLNTLISTGGRNPLKEKLYIKIDDTGIHGEFSVPLGKETPKAFQGRYINGRGDLKFVFQDGDLRVWVENLSAHGKPIPKLLAKQLSKRNLAEGLLNNPEAYNTLQQLESISVTNGKLVLQPKEP